MKNIFIELTDTSDTKILLNVMHIAWIETGKNGVSIKSNMVNYSFPTKVKESYEQVKSLIVSLNSD
ncbi:MAG: hypothetical protein ABSA76_14370 [Bacteroidales bacterium]